VETCDGPRVTCRNDRWMRWSDVIVEWSGSVSVAARAPAASRRRRAASRTRRISPLTGAIATPVVPSMVMDWPSQVRSVTACAPSAVRFTAPQMEKVASYPPAAPVAPRAEGEGRLECPPRACAQARRGRVATHTFHLERERLERRKRRRGECGQLEEVGCPGVRLGVRTDGMSSYVSEGLMKAHRTT